MMDNLRDLAQGCRALHIEVQRGDLHLAAAEDADWTLEVSSSHNDLPEIVRDGDLLTICQRGHGGWRMDLRLTMPRGVERVEASSGMGNVEAGGLQGNGTLSSGHGHVSLDGAQGDFTLSSGNGRVEVRQVRGSLVASSGNGSLHGDHLHGHITLSSGNGRVDLHESDGELRISTGNGDVTLLEVGGDGKIETGHGQIEVHRSRALTLAATTGAGDIAVADGSVQALRLTSMVGKVSSTAHLLPGSYELESSMGAVSITVPWGVSARVNAQTGFGKVTSDIPLVRVGRSGPMSFGGERMVGSAGEGEPAIDVSLRTSHGSISVIQARQGAEGPEAATPPTYAEAATPPAEATEEPAPDSKTSGATLTVLEALARGEISPAEAEDLLYGLQRR
jgi:DUF4097 and DUF4098 domain-containing protein YvlB